MSKAVSFTRRQMLAISAALPTLPLLARKAMAQDSGAQDLGAQDLGAPPPLRAFGRLPAIENVALSPDGKRVALVMDKDGERVLYDYDLATGEAAAAVLEGDKLREVIWADEKRILVVVSKTEIYNAAKYEQWYGLLMDLPAGKRRQLYSNMTNVVTSVVTGDFNRVKMDGAYRITAGGFIQPQGISTANSGATLTESMNHCLFAFNPATGHAAKLDEDARPVRDWVVAPDGRVVARSEYDDETKTWTLRFKGEKGWKTLMEVPVKLDMPWLGGLGRDGKSILVYFDGGEDAGKYFEYDESGSRTAIDIDGETHWPVFHPGTKALAGFANGSPIEDWVYYDPIMKGLPKLVEQALPDSRNDVQAMAESPRKVVIRSENAEDPGTYFFFDFTTGAYKEIGRSYPDIPAEWVAVRAAHQYKAADGLEINGYLTLPPGRDAKNLPLIVFPHGGPEAMDDARFDWISQALASRGYAVLQPNYRGSSGYGTAFTAKGHGEFGRKMQTDLSDGVAELVKEGIVDPKRVAIAGASYGGYAALAGVSLQAGVYRCAISLAGLSNMRSFMAYRRERAGFDGKAYALEYWRRFTGGEERMDEISPVRFADKVAVPVMLIHGKDDVVVPFDQSQQMYDALTKLSKPVELVVLREEDHWLSREPSRVQFLETMMAFLQKHNPV